MPTDDINMRKFKDNYETMTLNSVQRILLISLLLIGPNCASFSTVSLERIFEHRHHISCSKACKGPEDDMDREICSCVIKEPKQWRKY